MSVKASQFAAYINKGIDYDTYLALIKDLLSENKTTGNDQSEHMIEYTRLNLQRMERLNKTIVLDDELKHAAEATDTEQVWLCITEAWCGDAAQNLPVFAALARLNKKIDLRFVLRDENLELMDQYLTNGSRSIPVVIGIDKNSHKELWKWGPRPAVAQQMINDFKQHPDRPAEQLKTELHTWYAHNKTKDVQAELLKLIG